jgi:2-aminophenol/2-amino-5-chlorophenol 1,6-dioxygenase alpha subunit
MAVAKAKAQGKRVAMVGIGLLSGSIFRQEIDVAKDRVADPAEDAWNKRILGLLERADVAGLRGVAGDYAKQAKVDMGFKHMFWLLGGLGGSFSSAKVHAYGPVYGNGAAVVELRPN